MNSKSSRKAPPSAEAARAPFATAENFQALKTTPRLYRRIVDDVELGHRVCGRITEVTR